MQPSEEELQAALRQLTGEITQVPPVYSAIKIKGQRACDLMRQNIAVEIPERHVGFICMKSSISKRSIIMCNGIGVIDSDYRGELMAKFKVTTDAIPTVYTTDEPFAQLVIVPCSILEPTLVEELSETERGEKGFGEATAEQNNEIKEVKE